MRMPVMTGAVFLSRACVAAPDTVRLLLTGQSDLDDAIAAVNEGSIFRFLKKPCSPEVLRGALGAAVEQNRLITSEKVLLEQTLRGAVKALTETLALANPSVFGTSARVKDTAVAVAAALGLAETWPIEIAALVAQLGAVTLPPEVHERLVRNQPLTWEESAMIARTPEITERLLANIPRLEPVIEIVRYGRCGFSDDALPGGIERARIPIGARILKAAVDFDQLEAGGSPPLVALDQMRARAGTYHPDVLRALATVYERTTVVDAVPIGELRPGMVLAVDVRTKSGTLLVARGHEVTAGLVARLANFATELSVITVSVLVRTEAVLPQPPNASS